MYFMVVHSNVCLCDKREMKTIITFKFLYSMNLLFWKMKYGVAISLQRKEHRSNYLWIHQLGRENYEYPYQTE